MSDHYIGLDLFDLENNGLRQPISRITLYRGDNAALTAGDDTGLEVVADCIYVTKEMVEALLSAARGYQYHAYSAQAARLNPAAELGDTVEVGSIVSVLAQISDNGDLYPDIAAPGDREVEDEYPAAGPLTKAFDKKLAEARSEITKTTDKIALAIYGKDCKGGLNGKMATFTASLSTIGSKVESVETKAAEDLEAAKKALEEDIAGLDQSFSDALRNLGNDFTVQLSKYSTIEQTDEKIATEVKSVKRYTDGKAEELDQSVSIKLEKYSTIEQTDSKIQSTVSSNAEYTNRQVDNLGNAFINQLSKYSTIEQTDEKIATRVAKGSIISEINQSAETVQISASKINLNGYVTFSSLSSAPGEDGTKINGGWIQTGTITGNHIAANSIEATHLKADTIVAGSLMGETVHLHSVAEETAEGVKIYDAGEIAITGAETTEFSVDLISNGSLRLATNLYEDEDEDEMFAGPIFLGVGRYWGGKNYKYLAHLSIEEVDRLGFQISAGTNIIPSDSGFDLGHDHYPWNNIYSIQNYAETGEAGTSDRNKKNSISYDLSRYDAFFDRLQPTIYKLNNGTSGRFHVGMIAQDVEKALADSGIPTSDFGGYIKMKDTYALRYGEFIGLLIDQVQKLKARVAELEERL